MARERSALIVVGSGPDGERGWLGLRTALALGVAGFDVTVWLTGPGALFAQPLDARSWLGGDPAADIDGLVGDLGARVLVDERGAADGDPAPLRPLRAGIDPGAAADYRAISSVADLVVAF
ncbi:MAG TPA: DsrE family protein [Candidatus Dormibacteraeota bacterium]